MEPQNWPYFLGIVRDFREVPKPNTTSQNKAGCGNVVNPEWEGSLGWLPIGTKGCQEAGARVQGRVYLSSNLLNWEKKQGGA